MVNMKSNEIKLCRDCKYCIPNYTWPDGYLDKCSHPKAKKKVNLITGGTEQSSCGVERMTNCGEEALHFEPREAQTYEESILFRWLFGS